MIDIKDIYSTLQTMTNADYAEEEFQRKKITGIFNRLDLSEIKADELTIESEFTNHLDLSESKIKKLVLIGWFVNVDLYGAEVDIINRNQAKVINIDR